MNSESQQKIYCSQISIREGEPLTGTATRTQVNFLLEYNGTWGERAFEESNLPAVVKEYMVAQTKAMAESRILLLRREGGQVGWLHFFVASVTEGNEAIYEFHLDSYEDLLSLDMAAITASGPGYVEYQRKAPLFLVCTHGRRDACCARFGLPVYQALRSELGEAIWQCSHVGGHRFAANLL